MLQLDYNNEDRPAPLSIRDIICSKMSFRLDYKGRARRENYSRTPLVERLLIEENK